MAAGKDSVDVPDYEENVNEFDLPDSNAGSDTGKDGDVHRRSPSSSTKSGGRSSRSTQDTEDEQEKTEDSTKRKPFTTTLENGLRSRLNGIVHHAQTVGTPPGITSQADYVNRAVAEQLKRDEKKYNGGKAYPEPAYMRTGRPRKSR